MLHVHHGDCKREDIAFVSYIVDQRWKAQCYLCIGVGGGHPHSVEQHTRTIHHCQKEGTNEAVLPMYSTSSWRSFVRWLRLYNGEHEERRTWAQMHRHRQLTCSTSTHRANRSTRCRRQMESTPEKIFIIHEYSDGEKVGLPIFYCPHFIVCRLHYSNINAERPRSNVCFSKYCRVCWETRRLSRAFLFSGIFVGRLAVSAGSAASERVV